MYMPLRITKQRCSSKNHVTFSHYFGERRTFSGPSPAIPMSYLALVGAPAEKSRSQAGSWAKDHDLDMRGAACGIQGVAHCAPSHAGPCGARLLPGRPARGAVHVTQARSTCGGELGKSHARAPSST